MALSYYKYGMNYLGSICVHLAVIEANSRSYVSKDASYMTFASTSQHTYSRIY